MKHLILIGLFSLVLSAFWIGVASAQQPTPANGGVNGIARQMYCRVCEITPLDVCATQACAQWRALIREKLAAGWTDEQIKQYFVEQYGVRVLAKPPGGGWYAFVYIIPPVLFVLGAFILYRAFVSMRKPAVTNVEPGATPSVQGDDEYLHRVEEELKKRK